MPGRSLALPLSHTHKEVACISEAFPASVPRYKASEYFQPAQKEREGIDQNYEIATVILEIVHFIHK